MAFNWPSRHSDYLNPEDPDPYLSDEELDLFFIQLEEYYRNYEEEKSAIRDNF